MEKSKKKYIKPAMQVYNIEPTTLLASSPILVVLFTMR